MNRPLKIIVISDIHFGAFDAEVLFNELKEEFIEKLKEMEYIDLIVIDGDYFDTKLNMNSKHAKYSMRLFSMIVKIAVKKGAKVRVIQGTVSHDNNQLELLEIEHGGGICDVKFIYNVTEEEIFKDFNVLYIPEEYVSNKDEYYGDFYNKKYDMIFGHGMVQEVSFCALSQESATTMTKAPIFNTDKFKEMVYGLVVFGHIHTSQLIKDTVLYVGSFSRWMHGEEEDKGFYEIEYNVDTKEYNTKFHVNKLARRFDTVDIYPDNGFFTQKPEDQINFIYELYNEKQAEFLRIRINLPDDYENEKFLMGLINDAFSNYKQIKIVFNSNNKVKTKQQTEEKVNILLEKYGFIFAKTIDYDIKIARFIQEKYGRNIPVEKIREYIFGDRK
ncbi:metallophosphoesterase [Romboutsia ilealis]|uniref:metallophosphoesterase n=1 Tax=Romboutsia ilealis TaxID=1115758 RepID=UPI00272C415F|nr:metallophosphoesterase [Romboutsia ilealis]